MDGLERQYGGRIRFVRVNFDAPEGQHLARRYLVRAHPTVLIIDRAGEAVASIPGVPARARVEQEIRRVAP
ncbi:MAG TPA: thioredoxin family protein [Roseiflexaceae bacterium]|nr:thioredoxin family protein [Roseiflexaceae bacterium]